MHGPHTVHGMLEQQIDVAVARCVAAVLPLNRFGTAVKLLVSPPMHKVAR